VAVAPKLAAQNAPLAGTIRDTTGKPLADALVTIVGTAQTAYSNAQGAYRFVAVARGSLVLRVELIGFFTQTDTVVVAADSLHHDVVLRRRAGILLPDLPRTPVDTVNQQPVEIGPVVVTAAKRTQLLDQAFTSVVVVEPEQLQARALNTVDEAVDKAGGVQFLNGQVNIRGSTGYVQGLGSRVLLLVDGVPANQGDRGGISWDLVPAQDIERVEIVKGAGSALYGSAALGGVVNLLTREIPTGTHARAQVAGGIFADPPHPEWTFRPDPGLQERIDLFVSQGWERVRAGVGAGFQHSDGYREQDARDRWNLSGRGRWQSTNGLTTLNVSGAWTRDAYEVPLLWCTTGRCDAGDQAYQPFRVDTGGLGDRTVSHKGYLQAVVERAASARLRWQARASWLRTRFNDYQRSGDDNSTANRFGLEIRGVVHPPEDRTFTTVGVEGARADVSSDIFGTHTQGEYAAYGESERRLGRVRLTAGARVDFLAIDGGSLTGVLSPRLGLVLPSGAGVTRASVGRGFRAPSLAERFANTIVNGFVVVPNPGLNPETAWSMELGHHVVAGRVDADAAAFWTEADQLIEPVIDSVPIGDSVTIGIQFRNLERARLAGLDVTFAAQPLALLQTSLAYTFLYARELAQPGRPAQPLAFRPRHLLTLTAEYALGPATVGADFRFMSRMERVELFPEDRRVGAQVLDLRAGVTRGPLSARLLVTNALNYIYTLVPRTLAPVRTVSLSVNWEY
jgi:iron complex outermembrane receptor protein